MISKEIIVTTKKIDYFTYHIDRCKKENDKHKLIQDSFKQ